MYPAVAAVAYNSVDQIAGFNQFSCEFAFQCKCALLPFQKTLYEKFARFCVITINPKFSVIFFRITSYKSLKIFKNYSLLIFSKNGKLKRKTMADLNLFIEMFISK